MHQEYSQRKESYDQKIEGKPYRVGDLVWLHSLAVARGRSRKFDKPWVGPFKIVKIVSKLVYRIQHSDQPQKRFMVHFNQLKTYKATEKENASPQDLVKSSEDLKLTEVRYKQ